MTDTKSTSLCRNEDCKAQYALDDVWSCMNSGYSFEELKNQIKLYTENDPKEIFGDALDFEKETDEVFGFIKDELENQLLQVKKWKHTKYRAKYLKAKGAVDSFKRIINNYENWSVE